MSSTTEPVPGAEPPKPTAPLALKLLVAAAAVAALAGGFWLIAANIGEGTTSLAIGVAWWLLASIGLLLVARARRPLSVPIVGAIVVATLAAGVAGYVSSRETTVDEDIVTGVAAGEQAAGGGGGGASGSGVRDPAGEGAANRSKPARNVEIASGVFEGVSGHSGTGHAAVVELGDGSRVLTFSDFEVDPGAGTLRVYLAAGAPASDGEVTDFVDIAGLKGTQGDQQYEVPASVDLDRYTSAIVWCVPFSTRIAQAELG